jgi:Zn-dependent M28 family amino/carboxypeptidase
LRPRFLLLLTALAGPAPQVLAQTSPFVPETLYRDLVNEISGDRAFEYDRRLTPYHRTAGSRDFFAATEVIRQAAAAAGLEDVKLIRQKWDGHAWSCASGEAWLLEPEEVKLAAYGEVAVSIADNSRTTHVTAELVDVGAGTSDKDYEGKEVKGKIVLASGSPSRVTELAVWRRGALGILSSVTNRPEAFDAPDQVAWTRIPYEARGVEGVKDETPGTFAVVISPRRARWIQQRLAQAGKPLSVKVDIDASFAEPPEQAMVEAWIHGTEIHDQQIVLTAHIQEMTSANDDGSGCVSMLEVGRALERLMATGKLKRPRRDIRFWWVNELASEPRYFRDNPKEPRKMLLDINQDMVGARQSMGGRVQYASRLPWSLPHALDDVMESVLTMVRDGNTAVLTMRGTSLPVPFSREIVAVKGSREPFHARMVPYFDSTDHHAFTPASVGVPGTSLTNWPDEFIHSTGDDLDAVDATQLERNAVVVAAVALYFAHLTDEELPTLAAYVAARGRTRSAADVATAIAHIAQATPVARAAAYRAARNLVHHSYRKEAGALASLRRLSPRGRGADYASQAASRLQGAEEADLGTLERAYTAIAGAPPPNPELTKEEREMAGRVYAPVEDLATFHDAMQKVRRVSGLHSMMEFEVYNFADGRRNAHEVYEAVAAEALSAGEWYYGQVRPADVLEALEAGVKAGAFTVKGR